MLEITTPINEKGVFADQLAKGLIAQELQKYAGKYVTVTISDARKISKNQYGYLWGVIYKLIGRQYVLDKVNDGIAWDKKEMHNFFCTLFLEKKEVFHPYTGELVGVAQTTTSDLKMRDMALQFMENVIAWAAEYMNLNIPPPDPKWRENQTEILSE